MISATYSTHKVHGYRSNNMAKPKTKPESLKTTRPPSSSKSSPASSITFTPRTSQSNSNLKRLSKPRVPVELERCGSSEQSKRSRGLNSTEKKMDKEAEQVLREWDENVQKRAGSASRLRPIRSTGSARGRGSRNGSPKVDKKTKTKAKSLPIERVNEKDGVFDADDTTFDTSMESLDEEMRKPFYTMCPLTAKKIFRMQFDVHGYDIKDINVKISQRRLVVFARHKENDSGRKSTTEFCKKLKIPEDVNVDKLQCFLSDEHLVIEGPVLIKTSSVSKTSTSDVDSKNEVALNVPTVKQTVQGRVMHLFVEVGRIFKADDVLVRLKGRNKLIVTAERQEQNEFNKMSASLSREFEMPEPIFPDSLKAGLSHEGILNVCADVVTSPEPTSNGHEEKES